MPHDAAETMTVREAARALGLPLRTTYQYCETGALPHIRISRRILILRETVDGMVAAGRARQPELALDDARW